MKKTWRSSTVWTVVALIGGVVAFIAAMIWRPYAHSEVISE